MSSRGQTQTVQWLARRHRRPRRRQLKVQTEGCVRDRFINPETDQTHVASYQITAFDFFSLLTQKCVCVCVYTCGFRTLMIQEGGTMTPAWAPSEHGSSIWCSMKHVTLLWNCDEIQMFKGSFQPNENVCQVILYWVLFDGLVLVPGGPHFQVLNDNKMIMHLREFENGSLI